ncbi:hypothetical protein LINGRAHAP2_LOCUS35105 [Linum grandiflorum]
MSLFNDFIESLDLLELPLFGSEFTWSNMRDVPSFSRIDRALVSLDWEHYFSGCSLSAQVRCCSDHWPLVLSCYPLEIRKRPWKFKLMRLEHDNFKNFLQQCWQAEDGLSGSLFKLSKKLKSLKSKLIVWNKDCFKRVEVEIQRILGEIDVLDKKEEVNQLEEDERVSRCLLKCNLDKLWKMEEISWKQKFRDSWLKAGDRNTRYFHRLANYNRRKNTLNNITVDRILRQGHTELATAVVAFYDNLFSETTNVRPFPKGLRFSTINPSLAGDLVVPFSEHEIRNAVFSCVGDKAPGPDGVRLDKMFPRIAASA